MKYLIRSLKYFVALCVLCLALMALMLLTGTSALNLEQTLEMMFHTDRYAMLLGAIILLAAFYPRFGFVLRKVEGDVAKNREQIINAFKTAGFSLRDEANGVMSFRCDGIMQRLMLLGEDEIKVSQSRAHIVLDGIRRGIAKVEFRLDSYIQMSNRYE